jgi:uncharacterized protein (DUF4415 family)
MSEEATKYRTSDDSSRTPSEITRLDAAKTSPDESDDIPETPDVAWKTSARGRHAKAMDAAISTHLDAEVLAWLRAKGPGYGREINRILREKMLSEV